jgi:ATP-dependent DNA ligase
MVYVSQKLDGVPARFELQINPFGDNAVCTTIRSRQDEELVSCAGIGRELAKRLTFWLEKLPSDKREKWASAKLVVVGEVTHDSFKDFKDISGVVRRQSEQDGLRVGLFDFWSSVLNDAHASFLNRYALMEVIFRGVWNKSYVIPQALMPSTAAQTYCDLYLEEYPNAEGLIIRSTTETWQPGKRTWGYQKYVVDPTIDLFIVGVEEATSEDGQPLNMAGRLVASYKGREIGIGPGKLSHAERRELFAEFYQWQQAIKSGYKDTKWKRMAAIKYKRDDSYSDLRQPTFQAWRDDKETPDA